MGVKIAFGSRANNRGGEQMNGNSQGYQNNNGGGSQMNGGQNFQNNGGGQMAIPHMNTYGGPQMGGFPSQMNGGAMGMAMSYPVGTVPPGYMPGHPVPSHPQASQMGFLAPLEQMGEYPDYLGEEMRRGRSSRTGRFVHRAETERGEQMRGASSRGGEYEMGHAEADDDMEEELHELKAKCKKLKKKVKKLERELEEKDEESGSSGAKKKKKKHEDDEDDEEDDPEKKLGCALSKLFSMVPGLAEELFNVIAAPPQTWISYLQKGDLPGIAKMEFGELMKAVQEKKPLSSLKKEMLHTAAGLLMVCGK